MGGCNCKLHWNRQADEPVHLGSKLDPPWDKSTLPLPQSPQWAPGICTCYLSASCGVSLLTSERLTPNSSLTAQSYGFQSALLHRCCAVCRLYFLSCSTPEMQVSVCFSSQVLTGQMWKTGLECLKYAHGS